MAKKTDEPTETLSKSDAIRRAFATGLDKPKEVVEYVKTHFNIDVTAPTVSQLKLLDKKKSDTKTHVVSSRRNGKPKPSAIASPTLALDLARSVKALVDQYGADAVKAMAEIMA